MGLREWLRRRRGAREARAILTRAFRSPDLLRGTSLEPRHAGRWVLLDHEAREGRVVRIRFGILRHPRPYPFSAQSHKVVEVYRYNVETGRISVLQGHNLTRAQGEDAD